ncbi:RagB/SusD family nutrient uptake outer membrane protein [Pedobacter nyackensis]|uniref:Starch-binding associating with outer membrane n=1 Tax=Pedobacter nyackensis TaxID=475255 RepID=A0A1W2AAM1_9SPHI|nr:RagB/SusD family nutrient uptake outer membrane protein [Pedobacter nyackensis]SMC57522.1 Starch-binding associating with outer membrane [Pedobacter nyackensis]
MKTIIRNCKLGFLVLLIVNFFGCSKFLDVVPDGVATLDNAFSNRNSAEKFLFTCFNMMPNQNSPFDYPGNVGSDEIWWDIDYSAMNDFSGSQIARGNQNITNPFQNYWDGGNGGKSLWIGIRDCNIFLENIGRIRDISEYERARWISEVKFVKAYLHYFLFQMYGPIPIIDKNLPVNVEPSAVKVYRDPVDKVIDFIVNTLDESMTNLPDMIDDPAKEMGRPTKAAAAALKAKVLVWAASPLLNGNPDYANITDKQGTKLFPANVDPEKWSRALNAVKFAIELAEENGHKLYDYKNPLFNITGEIAMNFTLRGAVTERATQNPEIIFAPTTSANGFQNYCTPNFYNALVVGVQELSAPMKIAEQYYTDRGVPIDEDLSWDYANRFSTQRNADQTHKYYIAAGETTAKLNYKREARFYAHLGFDRGLYDVQSQSGITTGTVKNRAGEAMAATFSAQHIQTGYFIKKLVSFRSSITGTGPSAYNYTIPVIRLSDLYLLYAEVLNEVKNVPDNEVYQWIDKIRNRAGLEGVLASWNKYSSIPGKPTTKEGMREIIKHERMIEFAFEGQRAFDLRRWKDAVKYLNQPIEGWNFQGKDLNYYSLTTYFQKRNYTYKDYLWPLNQTAIIKNSSLMQNPGW